MAAAALKDQQTASRWLALAQEEVAAADADMTRARALLEDLTKEIAPIARLEVDARNNLQAAIDQQAGRDLAREKLGAEATTDADGNPVPATGAQAVLAAAIAARDSVNAQLVFHQERADWTAAALAPAAAHRAELE